MQNNDNLRKIFDIYSSRITSPTKERLRYKIVLQDCVTRVRYKSVLQECYCTLNIFR